jgi:putative DNA primase/helicase
VGNRERFIEQVGADVRYVPSFKAWMVWEGGCWRPDTGQVQEKAIEVARSVREEAQEAWSLGAKTEAKLLERHARRSEQAGSIGNMLRLASSHREVVATHGRLDANPMLLGCPNGTVDLRTGELREAARDDLITRQTLTHFDAQAQCPTFERFLGEVLGGDADLVEYVRRCIGYSLTGLTTEQCLFFLHGSGRNGKGTLVELLLEMLGGPASLEASAAEREERNGYAKTADFTTFLEQRNSGPRDDLAALRGARLVAASEPTAGRRLDEGFVKSITGGDAVTARFLYGQLFTFRPEFKLWLSANHKPGIRGTDHGIWRRIKLIPFNVTFTTASEREKGLEGPPVDKKLPGKLRKELPGILAWAVRACLDWQVDGLCEPAVVQKATEAYRSDMDLLGQFIADRCVVLASASAKASALYGEYKDWSTHNGRNNVMTQTAFGNELGSRGYQKKRTNKGMVYEGLGLVI